MYNRIIGSTERPTQQQETNMNTQAADTAFDIMNDLFGNTRIVDRAAKIFNGAYDGDDVDSALAATVDGLCARYLPVPSAYGEAVYAELRREMLCLAEEEAAGVIARLDD